MGVFMKCGVMEQLIIEAYQHVGELMRINRYVSMPVFASAEQQDLRVLELLLLTDVTLLETTGQAAALLADNHSDSGSSNHSGSAADHRGRSSARIQDEDAAHSSAHGSDGEGQAAAGQGGSGQRSQRRRRSSIPSKLISGVLNLKSRVRKSFHGGQQGNDGPINDALVVRVICDTKAPTLLSAASILSRYFREKSVNLGATSRCISPHDTDLKPDIRKLRKSGEDFSKQVFFMFLSPRAHMDPTYVCYLHECLEQSTSGHHHTKSTEFQGNNIVTINPLSHSVCPVSDWAGDAREGTLWSPLFWELVHSIHPQLGVEDIIQDFLTFRGMSAFRFRQRSATLWLALSSISS